MRLYNIDTGRFKQFYSEPPRYAIASHRWAAEADEITYQEVLAGCDIQKAGFMKLQGFVRFIRRNLPHISWLWIDTCCIDKSSSAELSETINSMFEWYKSATICLAFLSDVETHENTEQFRASEWFRRGWTLQELCSPPLVLFLSAGWDVIGYKGRERRNEIQTCSPGRCLNWEITSMTGVPANILGDSSLLSATNAVTKMKWASGRKTSRKEDRWYCLAGLVGVAPGANYGEGEARAKRKLLVELEQDGGIAKGQIEAVGKELEAHEVGMRTTMPPTEHPAVAREDEGPRRSITASLIKDGVAPAAAWELAKIEGDLIAMGHCSESARRIVGWVHQGHSLNGSIMVSRLMEKGYSSQAATSMSRLMLAGYSPAVAIRVSNLVGAGHTPEVAMRCSELIDRGHTVASALCITRLIAHGYAIGDALKISQLVDQGLSVAQAIATTTKPSKP